MALPSADTPLYNHPLPAIEEWLSDMGCEQDSQELHCWTIERPKWQAELMLDVDQLSVRYLNIEGRDIQRSFKYSLSRQDVEDAVFGGP
ncbi:MULTISPECIES: DUF3143 domain-containing protein [Leptolyngbya]|jgi:hypothetical protein|uniref:DUF3143 domain-containing protein n=2 Tax=Leptolyngbya boryana TaxID=1184 RepID=A0A1Z4JDA4_LEPBY|nr:MULTISPECIES: DUF3143 domain-containing protein [Leptolyngbya]BAY54427.1 hypothetical protein NIES2135_12440 [Leptolyngbya boryana NIES-2135]MBD1856815.1 DUF3143 domain-containing protein [Leptolyngbya sp. FACHB-1624]MBD2370065.1 DUF3143 domain-containing protein [Leptolyngbya sp. FACHB-161]MBD2376468.1 DUF3143 domain-containing protein [Leptolyngbya sp. FACHB-238]MBD2400742.1 DUF3143 domain-containing protein [Leptolyngbya sp. FACHB-239]